MWWKSGNDRCAAFYRAWHPIGTGQSRLVEDLAQQEAIVRSGFAERSLWPVSIFAFSALQISPLGFCASIGARQDVWKSSTTLGLG
jgi:hypothetical protein